MNQLSAIKTLVKMQVRFILFQKRVFFIIFILCVPIAVSAFMGSPEGKVERTALYAALYFLYVMVLPMLLAILYNGSIIQTEIASKTLTYLFVRPIPRWLVLCGQYAGVSLSLLATLTVSVVLSWFAGRCFGGAGLLFGLLHSCVLATIVYGALFGLIGILIPNRSTAAGLVYAVFVEGIVSMVPAVVSKLTVSHYLRTPYLKSIDPDLTSSFLVEVPGFMGNYSCWQVWTVALSVSAFCLALSGWIITHREFDVAKPEGQ